MGVRVDGGVVMVGGFEKGCEGRVVLLGVTWSEGGMKRGGVRVRTKVKQGRVRRILKKEKEGVWEGGREVQG